jgi:hypothetical protein
LFVIAGVGALGFSLMIHRPGVASAFDPGPRALPVGLGILLRQPVDNRSAPAEVLELNRWQPAAVMAALVGFAALLPWAGFAATTIGFVTGWLMVRKIRWWRALLTAVLLAAVALLLFGRLFKVQLPGGIWFGA